MLVAIINILPNQEKSSLQRTYVDLDSVHVMKSVDGKLVTVNPGKQKVEQALVVNSAWDGSVWQVERYLDKVLKDPDSFEAIEWGKIVSSSGGYSVRLRYRAKNSLGAYVVEQYRYFLDHEGNVIRVLNE
ncbi:MAG: hypothetical protein KUA37_02065 [Desulfomicrobium sp.]|nr:hypothetical protein [Pseudomonadota bacterium]MBU4570385.1 hypothetical protein [Pseudomonadota bacterium]MBU4593306.1 hypothetical protein [Pseudomonadota bacterium]MBV1710777.1 hypothetical protein [Desulfomicrobium sp.]MBV1749669.1 hypothetical protein [Desulfomicrobium sp.]